VAETKIIIDNRSGRSLAQVWAHLGTVVCLGNQADDGRMVKARSVFYDGIVIRSVLNEHSERLVVLEVEPVKAMEASDGIGD